MFTNDSVIKCFPPSIIVGAQVGSEATIAAEYEDDYVNVQVLQQTH